MFPAASVACCLVLAPCRILTTAETGSRVRSLTFFRSGSEAEGLEIDRGYVITGNGTDVGICPARISVSNRASEARLHGSLQSRSLCEAGVERQVYALPHWQGGRATH